MYLGIWLWRRNRSHALDPPLSINCPTQRGRLPSSTNCSQEIVQGIIRADKVSFGPKSQILIPLVRQEYQFYRLIAPIPKRLLMMWDIAKLLVNVCTEVSIFLFTLLIYDNYQPTSSHVRPEKQTGCCKREKRNLLKWLIEEN